MAFDNRKLEIETPNGTVLERYEYLPPSYDGRIEVKQCVECNTLGIWPVEAYRKMSKNPNKSHCRNCDMVTEHTST